MKTISPCFRAFGCALILLGTRLVAADVTVGDRSVGCLDDPAYINRLHPDIPMIARVAVDLRIGQLVDVPNVGVTAILPLDVFL